MARRLWIILLSSALALSAQLGTAQIRGMSTTMTLGGARLSLSREEMQVLSDLASLVRSGQQAGQDRALDRARRTANGRDALYVLALFELEISRQKGDEALQALSLDVLIANPLTPEAKRAGHLASRAQIAFHAGDLAKADAAWTRAIALSPNNAVLLNSLAQVRVAQKDWQKASNLLDRAIALQEAGGAKPNETWYRQRLSVAQSGRLIEPGIAAAKALVTTHPTNANWRAALMVVRDLAPFTGSPEVDLLWLMWRVGVLEKAAEYQRFAQLLGREGRVEEARVVLAEAMVRKLVDAKLSPTREVLAELDRAAARKVADSAVPAGHGRQLRAGVEALTHDRRAEALAAFHAVKADPLAGRLADLAALWLASVDHHPTI